MRISDWSSDVCSSDLDDYACGISMNPSGAAEDIGDPTVNRMVRRAREVWGVGAYYQLNVMSVRGTYSADLAKAGKVNLPENDDWIRQIAAKARLVVVSWRSAEHTSELQSLMRISYDVFCLKKKN